MRSAGHDTRAAGVSFPAPRTRRGRLEVTVAGCEGQPVSARGLARWLTALAPRRATGDLAIVLVGDARMRSLNRRYRGIDAVTDVLSFPCERLGGAHGDEPAGGDGAGAWLGDIVIAKGRAIRQARAGRHSLGTELRVLALHGLLHLLGYDHEMDADRMARAEQRLRRKGGLSEGLLQRESEAGRRKGRA